MTFSKLGTDSDTGQVAYLPKAARFQGFYIIGMQRMGKSGLMENLIMQDIDQQIGVCVLDPHGELIDHVIARLPSDREKDVIYLDIHDYHHPFGLNLFTCADLTNPTEVQKTVDQIMHIFEKLLGVSHDTPLILQYLRNCTYTLIANPGYTMAEIPLLLTDKNCRHQLVTNVKRSQTRLFWQQYDQMKPSEQIEQMASIQRRVDDFLQDLILPIVGQAQTSIDFRRIMDDRKILLVRLDRTLDAVTSLIGSIIVALILNASAARQTQRQFHLYADEFQNFATEDFAVLLEQAGKCAIGVTMAHQNRSQLELSNKQADANLKTRTLNVGNIVVFRVPTDAEELAGQFDRTPPPAREEDIEIIDGEEAIQTISQDPIAHLLRYGHSNQRLRHYATEILEPLAHWTERITGDSNYVLHEGDKEYLAVRKHFQAGQRLINRLLVATMENHALLPAATLTNAIRDIVYELRGYIGFASSAQFRGAGGTPGYWDDKPLPPEESKTLNSCVSELISRLLIPDVISYLLNSTDAAYETIRQNAGRIYLTPLLFDAKKPSDTGIVFDGYEAAGREKDHHFYKDDARMYYSQRSLQVGILSVNEYLCAMMEQRIMPWSQEEINQLIDRFAVLFGWVQFATEYKAVKQQIPTGTQEEYVYEPLPEFTRQAIAYFLMYYQKINKESSEESKAEFQGAFKTLRAARYDYALSQLKDEVKRGKSEDEIVSLIAPRAEAEANRFLYFVASMQSVARKLIEHPIPQKNMDVLIGSKDVSVTKSECRCIEDFVKPLLQICIILEKEPIMVDSGRNQPRKRIQHIVHAQQTRADKEKEIAGQLIHLQKFTAWVKIAENIPQNPGKKCIKCGELNTFGAVNCSQCEIKLPASNEYIITTLQPPKGIQQLEQRIKRIQTYNIRDNYVKKREDVEREIIQRQTQCIGAIPAQPQIQSPQPQPRHARTVPVQGNCPNCGSSNNPSGANFCMQCGTKL